MHPTVVNDDDLRLLQAMHQYNTSLMCLRAEYLLENYVLPYFDHPTLLGVATPLIHLADQM